MEKEKTLPVQAQEDKPGRGRPGKEEAKLSRSINLKLTENDYEAIEQKAANIGMTPTQYARQMTLKGRIKPRYTKEELDLRRKIASMCNNVNQVARKAHSEGFIKEAIQAIMVLDKLKSLLDDSEPTSSAGRWSSPSGACSRRSRCRNGEER